MLPLSDGIPARRFPIVNVLLIVANFAVFIFYELGAYFVLYPGSRIRTWIFPVFLVRIPAWIFLGCGSCTSSSRRASGCSAPRRTGAAWRSSPTSAGSSSACW